METQARLIVDVARLDKGGETYRGELAPEALDLGWSDYITPLGGIHYDLRIQDLGSELLVQGRVWLPVQYICARCAQPFETVAEDNEFVRSIEINQQTDFVDLTEEAREAMILAFPGYPVCRETCQGLCPMCGKNLNEGPCGCREEPDDCWAGLTAPE